MRVGSYVPKGPQNSSMSMISLPRGRAKPFLTVSLIWPKMKLGSVSASVMIRPNLRWRPFAPGMKNSVSRSIPRQPPYSLLLMAAAVMATGCAFGKWNFNNSLMNSRFRLWFVIYLLVRVSGIRLNIVSFPLLRRTGGANPLSPIRSLLTSFLRPLLARGSKFIVDLMSAIIRLSVALLIGRWKTSIWSLILGMGNGTIPSIRTPFLNTEIR